jgi:DNA-3-methyladenine glycosylase
VRRLTRPFYEQDPLVVAPLLIGCVLVHDHPDGRTAVRLVETEAYRGLDDPGSHGYRGETPRTRVMHGPGGHIYVYFTYGMHWCMNVVCGPAGVCQAVLLRAGEPIEGAAMMFARRPVARSERLLASGPARLAQAMGIDGSHDGASLKRGSPFWIYEDATTATMRSAEVMQTPRIGLAKGRGDDLPWRWVVTGHPHASRRH